MISVSLKTSRSSYHHDGVSRYPTPLLDPEIPDDGGGVVSTTVMTPVHVYYCCTRLQALQHCTRSAIAMLATTECT